MERVSIACFRFKLAVDRRNSRGCVRVLEECTAAGAEDWRMRR
jgi:hypothetical protein